MRIITAVAQLAATYIIPLAIYLLLINFAALVCYYSDKQRARWSRWRISEATLITLAVIGGAFGALAGMLLFRHKTRKPGFLITVPLFCIVHGAFLILVISRLL